MVAESRRAAREGHGGTIDEILAKADTPPAAVPYSDDELRDWVQLNRKQHRNDVPAQRRAATLEQALRDRMELALLRRQLKDDADEISKYREEAVTGQAELTRLRAFRMTCDLASIEVDEEPTP
jgi:hypothetical protein